jgi:ATP-binding cassette, subfamily C (CFTR/MRP), member 10
VQYARAVGTRLAVAVMLSLVLMQLSRNACDWWLSQWTADVDDSSAGPGSDRIKHQTRCGLGCVVTPLTFLTFPVLVLFLRHWSGTDHLVVYGGVVAANFVFTLFRSFLFAYGGLRGAVRVHESLISSGASPPFVFWCHEKVCVSDSLLGICVLPSSRRPAVLFR